MPVTRRLNAGPCKRIRTREMNFNAAELLMRLTARSFVKDGEDMLLSIL